MKDVHCCGDPNAKEGIGRSDFRMCLYFTCRAASWAEDRRRIDCTYRKAEKMDALSNELLLTLCLHCLFRHQIFGGVSLLGRVRSGITKTRRRACTRTKD